MPPTSDGSLRVLVVDDHRDTADSCENLLRLWGFDVRVAYDGLSALGSVPTFQPHVVLLDLAMPGLDGFEVCRRIQAISTCTIIAVTGHGQPAVRERTLQAGFFCHLTKPVNPDNLQKILEYLKDDKKSLATLSPPRLP